MINTYTEDYTDAHMLQMHTVYTYGIVKLIKNDICTRIYFSVTII